MGAWPDPLDARQRLVRALSSPEAACLRLRAPVVAHHRLLEDRHWAVGRVPWFLWTRAILGEGEEWWSQASTESHLAAVAAVKRGGVVALAAEVVGRLESEEHRLAATRRARALLADVVVHAMLVRQAAAARGVLPTVATLPPMAALGQAEPMHVIQGMMRSAAAFNGTDKGAAAPAVHEAGSQTGAANLEAAKRKRPRRQPRRTRAADRAQAQTAAKDPHLRAIRRRTRDAAFGVGAAVDDARR
jgi:hypothetical protein